MAVEKGKRLTCDICGRQGFIRQVGHDYRNPKMERYEDRNDWFELMGLLTKTPGIEVLCQCCYMALLGLETVQHAEMHRLREEAPGDYYQEGLLSNKHRAEMMRKVSEMRAAGQQRQLEMDIDQEGMSMPYAAVVQGLGACSAERCSACPYYDVCTEKNHMPLVRDAFVLHKKMVAAYNHLSEEYKVLEESLKVDKEKMAERALNELTEENLPVNNA